ncbi:MAG: hypothetical protein HY698_15270 [Deltaproteobacteria bacterium]|nr:hypothetical protein [Deltaproteobacteria bacterium]
MDSRGALARVVALGERLASATDERSLAIICCSGLRSLLGAKAAALVTENTLVIDGLPPEEEFLRSLRSFAVDVVLSHTAPVVVADERLPSWIRKSAGVDVVLAPLRVQRILVGALIAMGLPDPATGRTLLQAIAQKATACLGSLRMIEEIRGQAREVEILLEQRTRKLRAAESSMIIRERLAAIGTLAAGVGHEIANPLASVFLNQSALALKLSRAELPPGLGAEVERLLAESDESLERIRTIINELRTLARRDDEISPLDVRTVVEAALRLSRAQLRHVEVRISLAPVEMVHGSAARLGQVFLNLIMNASQALAHVGGAVLDIRTEVLGDHVAITVEDNGPGIAAEHLPHVFDLYFTTKTQGEGTGLGLAIAHDIVSGHGGRIEAESSAGHGATFRVLLPIPRKTGGSPPRPLLP